jgi:hypothetical protein
MSELYQKITDICFENGRVSKPMVDKLEALFSSELEKAKKYQTNIKKITTLKSGKEVWGIAIAFEGRQVVGDIANSEGDAERKLKLHIAELTSHQPNVEEETK